LSSLGQIAPPVGGGGGGGLTDAQLRATPVPVSGTVTANAGTGTMAVSLATAPTTPVTGTFFQATQPVSAASLPLPLGAATEANQQTNALTNAQLRAAAVPIDLPDNNQDVYNQIVTVQRNIQLSLSFFALTPAAQLTITGTGSTSQSGGEGVFSSGVGVTNTLKAVSPSTLIYAPGFELYSSFSARFTVGTVTSVQRLGPYNATDGFSFGYNNTAFGLWSRFNTVDTIVAQASWNLDPCLAAATSKFTRNGVPEALDPTKTNIFRVRYGWHGAAAVFYEILAPDGDYVQVHVLRIANSLTTPSMISPNVPITLDIIKTAGATDIIMRCAAWSGGTTAPAAVKPPSIGAVATDPALVVAISPNNREIFRGRAGTFRAPGRAGTVGQNILSIHNATGSTITVVVNKVFVDLMQTVIKAVTVAPPIMRLWKVTVLPTNGTALTKNKIGGSGASNASVTLLQDASADGTGAGTTLTATRPAGTIISQEFAPRLITAAGYEMADRVEWLGDTQVVLAPLEGLVLFLDYVLATQNPTTDMWIAGIEWYEYTT